MALFDLPIDELERYAPAFALPQAHQIDWLRLQLEQST
jgi:cell division protein FtsL